MGRYYAMDRDKRWDRIQIAVEGLIHGKGEAVEGSDYVKTIEAKYEKDETDEFLKPIIVNGDHGRIKGAHPSLTTVMPAHKQADGDTLFMFNYRSDRMREISTVLGQLDKPVDVDIPKDLVRYACTVFLCGYLNTRQHITTMSRYNVEFPFPVAYPPQAMTNVLAEWLSKHGIKQAHIAGLSCALAFPYSFLTPPLRVETEKYAHVTFFFNGGVEKQFEDEERHMIDSPKVATYDKLPKMSVQGVADKVAEVVRAGKHEFVMCNFAPPDMVSVSYSRSFLFYLFSFTTPC